MKKYLIGILIVAIVFFVGIELFRKEKLEDSNNIDTTSTIQEDKKQENDESKDENTVDTENNSTSKMEEIKTGKDLLEKAEKTLSARGWAGASNNVIGLKDKVLYYYNVSTGEVKKIATGIEDIYYEKEISEDITVKKGENAQILSEDLTFLIYK